MTDTAQIARDVAALWPRASGYEAHRRRLELCESAAARQCPHLWEALELARLRLHWAATPAARAAAMRVAALEALCGLPTYRSTAGENTIHATAELFTCERN